MTKPPWEVAPHLGRRNTEEWRRYQRSRRLIQFARELETWERAGLIGHPRFVARVAYRQECLARWQDYLDGAIEAPTGRKSRNG